jgi:hypothetical protein
LVVPVHFRNLMMQENTFVIFYLNILPQLKHILQISILKYQLVRDNHYSHKTKGKMCVDNDHYGFVQEYKDIYDNSLGMKLRG